MGRQFGAAIVQAKRVCWAHEPYTCGAYAPFRPAADAQVALAQPVDDVLFFAGEATARESQSTDGAWRH
ncbi:MAG: FAD-dependent oxidoreductase [Caldilineaceae bacterium]